MPERKNVDDSSGRVVPIVEVVLSTAEKDASDTRDPGVQDGLACVRQFADESES
jgi:hypothetical protein